MLWHLCLFLLILSSDPQKQREEKMGTRVCLGDKAIQFDLRPLLLFLNGGKSWKLSDKGKCRQSHVSSEMETFSG